MKVYRSSILSRLRDLLGNQTLSDSVPMETGNNIMPVVEVGNRTTEVIANIAVGGTTGSTSIIYTTPVTKDFYLTSINVTYVKDVTEDSTNFYLDFYTESGIHYINIPYLPLTAESRNFQITFTYPLKLARNTAIRFLNITHTVGSIIKWGYIGGYIVE